MVFEGVDLVFIVFGMGGGIGFGVGVCFLDLLSMCFVILIYIL